MTAARERARELPRASDEGRDPRAAKEGARDAPHVTDLIDRYIQEHVTKLAKHNAGDQVSMLRKKLQPA